MQNNIWRKWNRQFDKLHFKDTEIKTSGDTIYINPAMKLLAGWGVFILLLILFLLIGKPFAKKENVPAPDGGDTKISDLGYTPFERNAYPEVNSFVENYLNALTNADINMLSTMVVDPNQFDAATLERRREQTLSDSNAECYTKPGLTEGSYIVYAVVNTQIAEVQVQPLSMHRFYLIPNEYGGYVQDNTTGTNTELADYISQIDQDPDVAELYTRVEQNNRESAKNDEALRAFYEKIGATVE